MTNDEPLASNQCEAMGSHARTFRLPGTTCIRVSLGSARMAMALVSSMFNVTGSALFGVPAKCYDCVNDVPGIVCQLPVD